MYTYLGIGDVAVELQEAHMAEGDMRLLLQPQHRSHKNDE